MIRNRLTLVVWSQQHNFRYVQYKFVRDFLVCRLETSKAKEKVDKADEWEKKFLLVRGRK